MTGSGEDRTVEQPAVAPPTVSTAPPPSRTQRWWSSIPSHLGPARTSTVVLGVLFLALGMLYLTVRPEETGAGTPAPTTPPASTTAPPATTTAPPTTEQAPTTEPEPDPTTEETTTPTEGPTTAVPTEETDTEEPTETVEPTTTAPSTTAPPTSTSSPIG